MALIESVSAALSMNITRLWHLLLYFLLVWESGCLAGCVKCDLGVFLKACWAVKRRCHYNFRFPLFSPLVHWYLLPVTPAITCSPQVLLVITLTSRVTCWGICNQFSCIPGTSEVSKGRSLQEAKKHFLKVIRLRRAFRYFLIFRSLIWNMFGSMWGMKSIWDFKDLCIWYG